MAKPARSKYVPFGPKEGHVHLHWLAFANRTTDQKSAIDVLSKSERGRAMKYLQTDDRDRYVAAHVYVRKVIASYLGCMPSAVPLSTSPSGQPLIEVAGSKLRYSLAHCATHAVVALSTAPIGVDIECARRVPDAVAIAERFFTHREAQIVRSVRNELRNSVFLRLWTCKEAFVKAIGLGLAYDLKRFCVAVDAAAPYFVALEPPYAPPSDWSLALKHANSCVVAIAARAADAVIVEFGLDDADGDERLLT